MALNRGKSVLCTNSHRNVKFTDIWNVKIWKHVDVKFTAIWNVKFLHLNQGLVQLRDTVVHWTLLLGTTIN
jgi:hypothetical protein